MYKLGQRENLKIDKINTEVLLKKDNENNFVRMNVEELTGEKVGDVVDVFIYNDNKKLLATKKQSKIELGKMAR
ncbi:RNA-binding protein, partial [Finegoldia magna]